MEYSRARGDEDFRLELLVVDLLKQRKGWALTSQLRWVFEQFRDHADTLSVVDPANGNNDLTPALVAVKYGLVMAAANTLRKIDKEGWQAVFGRIESVDRGSAAILIASAVPAASQYRPHGSDT